MEGVMTALAHKEQPLSGPVRFAAIAAVWACLTGVVGVHLHTEGACEDGFVVQKAAQLCKRPLGSMPVDSPLLLCGFLTMFALGPVSNASQVFQADETLGMSAQDVLTDRMIGIQLQPSLSLADDDASSCGRTSAFLLKPLLEAGVMVSFGAYFLSTVELCSIVQRGNGGKIAVPHIDPDNGGMALRRGVRDVHFQRNEQVEAPLAPIIPEFSCPDGCPHCEPGHMLVIAVVGQNQPPDGGQDTHPLALFQRIIAAITVGECGRDILGWRIQSLKPLFGIAQAAGLRVLPSPGPQGFIGSSHLPGDVTGHLSRNAKLAAYIIVGFFLQTQRIAGLAMRKGVLADKIQGVPIG